MPKLKTSDTSFDVDELEGAEWSEEDYYSGPVPPAGILLSGFVKRMWITETKEGADMLVVMFEASDNVGSYEQYNGWATWERLAIQANTKFRWQPFLNATGLTLKQLKSQLFVEDEEDRNGLPISKIGTWKPGDENDDAYLRILTKNDFYQGERRSIVGKFLEWDEPTAPDLEEEEVEVEEETPQPVRKGRAAKSDASSSGGARSRTRKAPEPEPEEEDEEEEEEYEEEELEEEFEEEEPEEEEEEEEPAPPARTRARNTARGASSARKPATAAQPAAKPAAAKPATRTRAKPAAAAPAKPAPTRRARSRAAATEEPPF